MRNICSFTHTVINIDFLEIGESTKFQWPLQNDVLFIENKTDACTRAPYLKGQVVWFCGEPRCWWDWRIPARLTTTPPPQSPGPALDFRTHQSHSVPGQRSAGALWTVGGAGGGWQGGRSFPNPGGTPAFMKPWRRASMLKQGMRKRFGSRVSTESRMQRKPVRGTGCEPGSVSREKRPRRHIHHCFKSPGKNPWCSGSLTIESYQEIYLIMWDLQITRLELKHSRPLWPEWSSLLSASPPWFLDQ